MAQSRAGHGSIKVNRVPRLHQGQKGGHGSIKAYKQKRQMSDEEFRLLTWKVYPDWLLEARHPVESDEEIVEENE